MVSLWEKFLKHRKDFHFLSHIQISINTEIEKNVKEHSFASLTVTI